MKQFLKELGLEEEIVNKILAKHNSDLETVTKSKDELQKALELSKQEISTRDKQLKELSKINVEELTEKLKTYEEENKALVDKHNKEMTQLKTDYAINQALNQAGARNIIATKSLLDIDSLKLDKDGNLIGLSEQIQKLINDENSSFLFAQKTQEKPTMFGISPVEKTNIENTAIPSDIQSYADLCKLYENGGIN